MSQATSFEARIALRPRSLDETFDLALAYLREFGRELRRPLIVATLVGAAPPIALWLLFGLSEAELVAIVVITAGFAERSVTTFAGRHLFANPASTGAAWKVTLQNSVFGLLSILFVMLPVCMMFGSDFEDMMTGLGVVLGCFWPFLLASHAHLAEVSHLEQLSFGRAAKRARALVSYRFGRALGLLISSVLVRALFVIGTYSAISFLFGLVLQFKGVSETLGPAFAVLGYALSGPYMALVRFFDYIDARTRREGWDIQVRFNAIAHKAREEREGRLAA